MWVSNGTLVTSAQAKMNENEIISEVIFEICSFPCESIILYNLWDGLRKNMPRNYSNLLPMAELNF